jgi:hypothetical protein
MIPDEFESSPVTDYVYTDLNSSGFSSAEVEPGFWAGLVDLGAAVGRFLGFVLFGVFLPSDTPAGFAIFLMFWNTSITLLFIGWFISIWWEG